MDTDNIIVSVTNHTLYLKTYLLARSDILYDFLRIARLGVLAQQKLPDLDRSSSPRMNYTMTHTTKNLYTSKERTCLW
jgi:hypothetical protein